MKDYFVDPNRGDDAKSGIGEANAVRTLARLSAINPDPGAGGGIYLASDGIHTLTPNRLASSQVGLYLFKGTDANNRAFMGAYDPAGASSTRPQVQSRWYPTSSDWTWDATLHNGAPKGWYIQYAWTALGWNMLVKCGGQYAVTTNQGNITGGGLINITENGLTASTLRFNANSVTPGAHRLYVAGGGISAQANPSVYFGPMGVEVGSRAFFIYDCGDYTVVDGLDFTGGSLLHYNVATADKQVQGVIVKNITSNSSGEIVVLGGSSSGTSTLLEADVSGCSMTNLVGPGVVAYGKGVAGRIHHNSVKTGNLASAQGASFYVVADSLSRSIDIEYNYGDDIRSGAGNCTFDGSFAYADSGSTNVRIRWNRCDNSYKAFQLNHGKYGELVGNVAYNCDVFATCTDADLKGTADYRVCNNTHYGTTGMDSFPRGVHSDEFTNAPLTFTAASGALVGITAVNNLIYSPGGTTGNAAIRALTSALYASKATVLNNAAIGFAAEAVQDWDSAGHTAGSGTLFSAPSFVNGAAGDVRLSTASAMIGAGVTSALSVADAKGRAYAAAPAVGAYERDPFVSIANLVI